MQYTIDYIISNNNMSVTQLSVYHLFMQFSYGKLNVNANALSRQNTIVQLKSLEAKVRIIDEIDELNNIYIDSRSTR